jgi:hypothetical protein
MPKPDPASVNPRAGPAAGQLILWRLPFALLTPGPVLGVLAR